MMLSLRRQLLLAFILVVGSAIVISVVSFNSITSTRNTLNNVFEEDFIPYSAISKARTAFVRWTRVFDMMVDFPEQVTEYEQSAIELREELQDLINQTMSLQISETGKSLLDTINENIARVSVLREQLVTAIEQQQPEVVEVAYSEIQSVSSLIEDGITEFGELQENQFVQRIESVEENANRSITTIITLIVILLSISVVTMVIVFRILNSSLGRVLKSTQELSVSTNQIVATTAQLTSNSVQTSTAVNQVTTTVEETRQTSRISSDKAKYVSESAQNVYHVSNSGKKVIEQTIQSMNTIQQEMNQVAQSIMKLNEQSQTVSQIIDSVNDLAEATNILSVNASIEAAKAGEHGKGFSVVAREIRNLAERSKQATIRIKNVLSDIQKATSTTVLIAEQAGKKVDSGVQQSLHAKEAIEVLSNNITEAAQAATQIAASSQQQLAGMDQMAEGMNSINQATQQNVSSLRELENAMKNLHDLGERLNSVVDVL